MGAVSGDKWSAFCVCWTMEEIQALKFSIQILQILNSPGGNGWDRGTGKSLFPLRTCAADMNSPLALTAQLLGSSMVDSETGAHSF